MIRFSLVGNLRNAAKCYLAASYHSPAPPHMRQARVPAPQPAAAGHARQCPSVADQFRAHARCKLQCAAGAACASTVACWGPLPCLRRCERGPRPRREFRSRRGCRCGRRFGRLEIGACLLGGRRRAERSTSLKLLISAISRYLVDQRLYQCIGPGIKRGIAGFGNGETAILCPP